MIRKSLQFTASMVVLLVCLSLTTIVLSGFQGATPFLDPTKQWQTSDNITWLPLGEGPGGCGVALTTGAFAANPANSGGQAAPAVVRAQAQNNVYQVVTSAAASALTLTCDITPPNFRTTPNKGVSITGVTVFYGQQTTALASIASANTFNTVTLPAPAGAASGTVAAISGTPVFSPALASAQLGTTTSGQCFAQNVTPAAPILVNSTLQRVSFEMVFNSTAGTATTYQLCGVQVSYNNVAF